MSQRTYPNNPAVPMHGSAVTHHQHQLTTEPAPPPSGHMAPTGSYGGPHSVAAGGRMPVGYSMHPVPPTTQIQPAVNALVHGMQQMDIHRPSGGAGSVHPPARGPGPGQPLTVGQGSYPPQPLKSGQGYGPPPWGPAGLTKSVPLSGQVSGQGISGQGRVQPPPLSHAGPLPPPLSHAGPLPPPLSHAGPLPPPLSHAGPLPPPLSHAGPLPPPLSHTGPLPPPLSHTGPLPPPLSHTGPLPPPLSHTGPLPPPLSHTGPLPPPISSGQLARQASEPTSEAVWQNSRQGLLPTPGSGHGLLPPPTSGHALLPPPPVSGHGILPTPPVGQGLLPPPTGQAVGQPSGHGLLPPPTAPPTGQQHQPVSSMHLPPPPPTGTHAGQTQGQSAGRGIISQPPRLLGQGPPPVSGQASGSDSLPPPPMPGQQYPPPGQRRIPGPPSTSAGMIGQAPPPPPTSAVAPPPSSQAQMSYPPHTHPQPPQNPQRPVTDPELKPVNMMETRNVMPQSPLIPPKIVLPGGLGVFNPKPEVMCCTMNAVPTTSNLLGKMKLPLAMHIHPFKDLSTQECPVVYPSVIVRCRVCRAYINPFVVFIDSRHWRCNLCFRPNTLPEEFDYNSQTGKHGDRSQKMEIKRSSVEYIAPSEYMLRPPQPSVYFFVIDVSFSSVQSGALAVTCRCLLDCLGRLPGDARTLVGFLTCDSSLHFYNLSVGNSQPQQLVVADVDDVFLPSPDSLLVNLKESKDLVGTLLEDLPGMFSETSDTHCALGAAVQVAEKLLHSIGGRVTVILSCLPDVGPGALKKRDVNPSATKKDTLSMAPGSDFYKKLALELSSQQIAVDIFSLSSQFTDHTTLSCVAKFSSGQVFYYPNFHHSDVISRERFEKDFIRYLTRRIGFEAVMRIRCTEGLSLHTFHGNFFVRSTDLLSLPNTNPDHGYTISLSIDESLKDTSAVCFQAALLYTSSRGERRIRVHSLCLPVSSQPSVLYSKLNVNAITGVLANMAVDRATSSNLGDARDALLNTVVDCTKMYRSQVASANCPPFTLPSSLAQLPLYILSLLKNPAFTLSSRITYDVRAQAMNMIKSHPLYYLMPTIYPSLYALHTLNEQNIVETDSGQQIVDAPLLQLSPENLSRYGIFLLDCGLSMYIWVSSDAPPQLISKIFGVDTFEAIPEDMISLPQQENESSKVVNRLIKQIRLSRQHPVSLLVIRERGPKRLLFIDRLLDGKTEDGTSYYEFLAHINRQLGK